MSVLIEIRNIMDRCRKPLEIGMRVNVFEPDGYKWPSTYTIQSFYGSYCSIDNICYIHTRLMDEKTGLKSVYCPKISCLERIE